MSKAQLQALLAERTAEFARYGGEVVRYASPEKPDRIKLGAFRAVPNLMAQEWEKEVATAEQEKRAREWDRDLGAMLASSIGRRLTIVFRKTTGKPIRRYTGVLKEAPTKGNAVLWQDEEHRVIRLDAIEEVRRGASIIVRG